MFKAIKEFFTGKPAVVETPVEAPYKVEVEAKVEAVNAQPVETAPVETAPVEVVATTEAPKKAPAKKQQFDKKPAVKKPRGPRKPKVAK
jgi:hypothetical protein